MNSVKHEIYLCYLKFSRHSGKSIMVQNFSDLSMPQAPVFCIIYKDVPIKEYPIYTDVLEF